MPPSNNAEVHADSSTSKNTWGLGIQSILGGLFLALLVAAGLSLTLLGYRVVSRGVERSAIRRSDAITRAIARELELSVHAPIQTFVDHAARSLLVSADTLEKRLAYLPILLQVLQTNAFAKCVLVGFENGDSFLVLVIDSDTVRMRLNAPAGSTLAVFDCHGFHQPSESHELFFDNDLALKEERSVSVFDIVDTRTLDWYKKAMQNEDHVESGPYFFRPMQRQGIIVSEKSVSGKAVVGMLVDLQQVSDILNSERPTPGSHVALFNGSGYPIASDRHTNGSGGRQDIWAEENFAPVIQRAMAMYEEGKQGDNLRIRVDGAEWLVSLEELKQFSLAKYVLAVTIPVTSCSRKRIFSLATA